MTNKTHAVVPAERREVRVSPKEALILQLLLKSKRKMYGYEIVKATGGDVSLASVYTLLGRLEAKGLVSSQLEKATVKGYSLPKRWYTHTPGLTVRGRQNAVNSQKNRHQDKKAVPGMASV